MRPHRQPVSAYDGLSPGTTDSRKVATDRRSRRQSVVSVRRPGYDYDGLPLRTTVCRCLRRAAARYDGPSYAAAERRTVTTICLWIRRSACGYDGLPAAATVCLR